jgi:D-amino-acid dehydrogenase
MTASGSGPRVVVVGGGVIGVSCAYCLSRSGADVTLVERGRIAGEASFGNAGTVSAGHPPLNRPGRVREGLSRMFDPSNPLYVPPRWDPDLWRWLATFARHCTHEAVTRSMEVMAPMGHRTLALFETIVAEEEMTCEYRRDGYYDVCATEVGFDAARREADLIRSYGYAPEALGPEELRRREPALAPNTVGGVFYPDAATVDPLAFTRGLAGAAVRHGARIREGVEAAEVRVHGGRAVGVTLADGTFEPADVVVLATGPFSLDLAGRVGLRLPVQPGKGYHRDIPVGAGGAPALAIACVLHESSVFCTPLGGRVRLAGTMEFSGRNHVLRPERLEQLTRSARRAFRGFGDAAPVSEWAGLRPVSADGLPFVGPLPDLPGAWIATGHGMLGLTLGPVTGELVTRGVVAGEPVPESLAPSRHRLHS